MIEFNREKITGLAGIVAVLFCALLFAAEHFLLRGETVYSTQARLGDNVSFEVSKPGEPHLLAIRDSRLKKHRGAYILEFTIKDPKGNDVVKYDENIPGTKTRYVDFMPKTAGRHTLEINGKGVFTNPRLHITVLVNDKRLSRRFFF